MARLESLMQRHFVDYASYIVLDRAIPDLRDGLKPVQRRILYTLFRMHDGRYHKVANVIGETMKLHPHGDASIGDALVVLANKDFFVDRQGNFGNSITGHPAAAARYIECRLGELALETLFDEALTELVPSYDGRSREPVALPALLPVVLMLGAEGIAVGMSTRILPHNLRELWEAQVAWLEGRSFSLLPDFPQGGIMDAAAYDDGRGKVDVRARIETRGDRHVVIREIPFGTTTESLIASIEAAVQKGRVKLASIDDFTTDRVEIQLTPTRGIRPEEVIPQLYAYTDCSVGISSNVLVVRDRRPVEMTVSEVLAALTERLRELLRARLEHERGDLEDRRHWLTLEQVFVEKRVYKRIEDAESAEAVHREVVEGMRAWESLFVRPMSDDDVRRLLELRIRRISAYDIEKSRREVEEIQRRIAEVEENLADMTATSIAYVRDLIERYGERYPRRTEVGTIESVDKKAVAVQNLRLAYDPKTGFLGTAVRGEGFRLAVSEFDLVLGIAADGRYRVMPPPEKQLFSSRLLYCEVFDPERGAEFVVVYRDRQKVAWAKRVRIERFVRNREYRLVKEGGRLDLLLRPEEAGSVRLEFVPAKRQRVKEAHFDLRALAPTGVTARGTRLAPKPVRRLRHQAPARRAGRAPAEAPPARPRPARPRDEGGGGGRGGQGELF